MHVDAGKYLIVNDDASAGFDLLSDFIVEITGGFDLTSLSTADFI